ncbi:hypothetical protein ACPOLB_24910 [Rubrivivax sp. RP6-9]|uniref:hypothetical protein n=1 Tax=Rubrivivax sp. RP6-9 TaxID=3415750 RepID=UPI003CC56269
MKTQNPGVPAAPAVPGRGTVADIPAPSNPPTGHASAHGAAAAPRQRRLAADTSATQPPGQAPARATPPADRPAPRGVGPALMAVGRAAMNSSAATALSGAAVAVADTVVPPASRRVVAHVATSLQRASEGAAQVRADLQTALHDLQLQSGSPEAQDAAHQALRRYARSTAGYADCMLPVVHKTLAVGAAGAGMAFGVGRSSGVALADLALRSARGDPTSLGLQAPALPAGRPGTDAVVNAAAQAALGAAMGGMGSFVGQTLVAPLVNRINRQSAPVDLRAVVPDEMVALMNQLQPGAGDALRSAAQAEQQQNVNIASERNVAVGKFFFDAANAVRVGMQGSNTLGVAGNVLAGTAVSSSAGACIGATIAINASLAQVRVPDLDQLRAKAGERGAGPADLDALPTHAVPLFFTKHGTRPETMFSNPVADPPPSREAVRGDAPGAPPPHTPSRLASAINAATSMAQRGVAMFQATTGTTVVAAMTPAFAASMPTQNQADAARAIAAAVGIHTAIQPWFSELAAGIPARDRAIVASRQTAVDDAARRQHDAGAQPVLPSDIEMVDVRTPQAATPAPSTAQVASGAELPPG